ncbi:MAG: HDIG domain-containing protein [Bacteroidetes bacterium]|nr:HDIG domain-containing protein [Bacteroidota bacterium]
MKYSWNKKGAILLAFLGAAILLSLLLPTKGKFKYEYQKGEIWGYENVTAPFDFPILKSQEELKKEQEAMASHIRPYYVFMNQVEADRLRSLIQRIKPDADSVILFERVLAIMDEIYRKGIMNREEQEGMAPDGIVVLVDGMESFERPAWELFNPATAADYLAEMLGPVVGRGLSPLLMEQWSLSDYLAPNLRFDEKTTLSVQQNRLTDIAVAKGRVYSGQLLVARGAVLDDDAVQILDSFQAEYYRAYGFLGNRHLLQLGQLIAMLLCMAALYITLTFLYPASLTNKSYLGFILVQPPVMLLTAVLLGHINAGGLFMIPFPVFALYTAAFFPSRLALPLYWIGLLPITLMAPHGMEWLFLNAGAGAVAVFVFHFWNRGWMQFFSAFIVFICYTFGYIAFRLIENGSFVAMEWRFCRYFLGNALLIIAAYPVVYLWEHLFGFVSESRLKELSDTTTPLMQLFAQKAPGSMQHALQVANLADAAAREVGANALLARVGALYHDIGKMGKPAYFIENQRGLNPHQELSPEESAKIIINHVDQGIELAKQYRVPPLVSDFIRSHHGTTMTAYFYRIFCDRGGDPAQTAPFCYRGKLPVSKEEAIVMMADVAEAGARSLTDYSPERLDEMIDRMVWERISGRQFDQANISMKEIVSVKEVLKKRLLEIYHQRIAYPV